MLVWICQFPFPLGVWKGLQFVIVALPGLFSEYLKLCSLHMFRQHEDKCWSGTLLLTCVQLMLEVNAGLKLCSLHMFRQHEDKCWSGTLLLTCVQLMLEVNVGLKLCSLHMFRQHENKCWSGTFLFTCV